MNISKHFSWGQDAPFLLALAILLPPPFARNSQPFSVNGFRPLSAAPWVREVHARCLLYPEYHSRRWHVHILPVLDWDQKQWLIVPTHYPFHLASLAGHRNNSSISFTVHVKVDWSSTTLVWRTLAKFGECRRDWHFITDINSSGLINLMELHQKNARTAYWVPIPLTEVGDQVVSTELTRKGDRSAISLLHPISRAQNIEGVIRRDLDQSASEYKPKIGKSKTYALIRRFPLHAFRHSDLQLDTQLR